MRAHAIPILMILSILFVFTARAENAAKPQGEPVLDPPTLHSLGVYWIVQGDDNRNAKIDCHYRKMGEKDWKAGPPLFRVEKGGQNGFGKEKNESQLKALTDAWIFAGSMLLLEPDTAYEIQLMLSDPDGGAAEKVLQARTNAEPVAPKDAPQHHVVPGSGGGSGTASDPYKGLAEAEKNAKPGDVFLLHAGVYEGPFEVRKSGEPGKPIVWRGAGDGEAVLDGKQPKDKLTGSLIEATGVHDVWFEKLSLRNTYNLVKAHDAARIVVRRCQLSGMICGVFAVGPKTAQFFIADNVMEGVMPWPTTHEQWGALPESRAIWLAGGGHEACYNRITHCKDGMDTQESPHSVAVDFHHNDVSEMFDDGCEMDGSERNTRCWMNRFTNVFQGVSIQPVFGGPVYVFRNALYNVQVEPFKMHNAPSGGIFYHNTIVKNGAPLLMQTPEKVRNCVYRNNLFLGTEGRALHFDSPMENCDYDYDGFGGFSGDVFMKWNNVKYLSPEEIKTKSPIYKHLVLVDPKSAFANGVQPPADNQKVYELSLNDLRLKDGCAAIDAGEVLPGFNDGFAGKAPDLGAYELGEPVPHYGPRAEK
ncbi:MAG: hypothetical protein HY291_20415 [Planctomycetes bacterium]|nr:hypothetical protein [Planctomycetota bacterium]